MVIISSVLLLLCGLVTRKFSLQVFDNRILGYAGTVENIFSWLHMAECGISSAISYRLYEALSKKNANHVSLFMSCYQWLYRVVGIVIFGAGLLLIPLLSMIFVEEKIEWNQVYTIYFIMLAGASSSYFLTFRRVLYLATQREYIYRSIDTAVSIVNAFGKILIVLVFPFYWIYYLFPILITIFGNLFLAILYQRDYPEVQHVKVSINLIKNLGIFKETKHYFVRKIADAANNAIDSIVLARCVGVMAVTLVGNYAHFSNSVSDSVASAINALNGSTGNLIYDEKVSLERKAQIFFGLNRVILWISLVVMICLNCLFQPFISLWLGDKYLLGFSYVFLLASFVFFKLNHQLMIAFREPQGHFNCDMWHYTAAALINIVGSFLLVQFMGITGVQLCTVIARLVIILGNLLVIDRYFLSGCSTKYLLLLTAAYIAGVVETGTFIFFTQESPKTIIGFLGYSVFIFGFASILNLPLVFWGNDASYVREKSAQFIKAFLHFGK